MRLITCLFVLLFLGQSGLAEEALQFDWLQFRGSSGTGHTSARNLPSSWGSFLQPYAWKASIPGRGWSSPIVVGKQIWLTTAETTALTESVATQKLIDSSTGITDFQTHRSVTFFAIQLDLDSGRIARTIELFSVEQPPPIHASNSYASPTPVSDGQNLYCHFGSLGTLALALESGTILWKKAFEVDDMTGSGGSPVLCGDRLVVNCDGADEQFVVALDKRTGKVLWKTSRPPIETKENFLRRAFSTPLVIQYNGRTQLISPTAQWLVSYDPATGNEWWRCKTAVGYSVIPQPAFHGGLVLTCTGYMKPELWAIRADGSGDVSETHVAWKHHRQVPEIASPIVIDDAIYFVSEQGILSCLEVKNGNPRWQQRLDGRFVASPIFGDGKLYLTNRTGLTTVLKPGASYFEMAKNQTQGESMATMVVARESLLLRTDPVLYCIRNISKNE